MRIVNFLLRIVRAQLKMLNESVFPNETVKDIRLFRIRMKVLLLKLIKSYIILNYRDPIAVVMEFVRSNQLPIFYAEKCS